MIVEFENPWALVTPIGSLILNAATGRRYLLEPGGCDGGVDMRVTLDNVPQGDGGIPHREFTTGYKLRLTAQLRVGGDHAESPPACGEDRVDMGDELARYAWATQNPDLSVGPSRLVWTPTGKASRMLDQVRLLERPIPTREDGVLTRVSFAVYSPFPYYQDETEIATALADGVPSTLTNAGSIGFLPVAKVYGPTSAFTLENATTGEQLVYDSAFPGAAAIPGGSYVEFDFFRNTAYLNGSGASRKAGIDVTASDFFELVVGDNILTITGATADVLWASAYR